MAGSAAPVTCRIQGAQVGERGDVNADWLTVFQLPAYAPDLNRLITGG